MEKRYIAPYLGPSTHSFFSLIAVYLNKFVPLNANLAAVGFEADNSI